VKAFPEPSGKIRYLTEDEAKALIQKSSDYLRPIVITALHTGGRPSEVLSLKWPDIDLQNSVLYFDRDNTKASKQREIPINPELAAVLREHGRVRSITGYLFTWHNHPIHRVGDAFEAARKRADLGDDVTFHTLRHTFASWYMINGARNGV